MTTNVLVAKLKRDGLPPLVGHVVEIAGMIESMLGDDDASEPIEMAVTLFWMPLDELESLEDWSP